MVAVPLDIHFPMNADPCSGRIGLFCIPSNKENKMECRSS